MRKRSIPFMLSSTPSGRVPIKVTLAAMRSLLSETQLVRTLKVPFVFWPKVARWAPNLSLPIMVPDVE